MSTTITFKGIPEGRTCEMQPYREADMAFTNDKWGTWSAPIGYAGYVGTGYQSSEIHVAHNQGLAFDLVSIDFCDAGSPTDNVTFTGTLADSSTVTATFPVSGFDTFTPQNLTNLVKLTFAVGNVGFRNFVFDLSGS